MRPFQFVKVNSPDSALSKKNAKAQFVAGGTNQVDLMKKDIHQPEVIIDINKAIPATLTVQKDSTRIGAMMRNSEVAEHEKIRTSFPLLAKAILAGATPQIRNMASTGGNLLQRTRCPYFYDITMPCNKRNPGTGCSALNGNNRIHAIAGWSEQCVAVHPSDMCVALAALDARVIVKDKTNNETQIPFSDFHRLPGNTPHLDNNLPADALIHSIQLPASGLYRNNAYVKIRDRDSYAFALISVAAALHLDGNTIIQARLASGGVAHKPWRWTASEEFLKGRTATIENFRQAADIAVKETKPLLHNAYKLPMLRGAIETALLQSLNVK